MTEYVWQLVNSDAQLQMKLVSKQSFSYELNKDIKD